VCVCSEASTFYSNKGSVKISNLHW